MYVIKCSRNWYYEGDFSWARSQRYAKRLTLEEAKAIKTSDEVESAARIVKLVSNPWKRMTKAWHAGLLKLLIDMTDIAKEEGLDL